MPSVPPRALRVILFLLTFAAVAVSARAGEFSSYGPPQLRDGLEFKPFVWREIATHRVDTGEAHGAIVLEAFLPDDFPVPEDNRIPLVLGVEVALDFRLEGKGERERASVGFTLDTPRGGERWLRPLRESNVLQGLRQSVRRGTQTVEAYAPLDTWSLIFPVTERAEAGSHSYGVRLGGRTVAQGSFTFYRLADRDRQLLQRAASVFFFSRIAQPALKRWLDERGGRMPSSREFMAEIESMPYIPATEYTLHRGMPRHYSQIGDPSETWLAREVDAAFDGKVVIFYADGSVGLGPPPGRSGRFGGSRRTDRWDDDW